MDAQRRYLPYRQIRKFFGVNQGRAVGYLPYRQLRNFSKLVVMKA